MMENIIAISGTKFEETVGKHHITVSEAHSYVLDINPSNRLHQHADEYEFNIVLSGTGTYYQYNTTYPLKRGDIFISAPGIIHEIASNRTKDLQILWFNVYIERSHLPLSGRYEDTLIDSFLNDFECFVANQKHLLHYIPLLATTTAERKPRIYGSYLATRNLVYEQMEIVTKEPLYYLNPVRRKPETILHLANKFIIDNIRESFSVGDVAHAACTSERNLRHVFKNLLNKTVKEVINEKKMQYAAHLLKMRLSVQEVSDYINIEDPAQFSRLFKKIYGISPKKFQLFQSPQIFKN